MSANVSKVANVIIPVADQDRALAFYTDTLGLDAPMGDAGRWIEVAPSGADTRSRSARRPGSTAGGKDTGITLQTDAIDAYHSQLKERGVDVDAEVSRFGDGIPPLLWFRDPEGNTLMVVEVH